MQGYLSSAINRVIVSHSDQQGHGERTGSGQTEAESPTKETIMIVQVNQGGKIQAKGKTIAKERRGSILHVKSTAWTYVEVVGVAKAGLGCGGLALP